MYGRNNSRYIQNPYARMVFSIVFLTLGLLASRIIWDKSTLYFDSRNWVETSTQIKESSIKSGIRSSSGKGRRISNVVYQANIVFIYYYEGRSYESNTFSLFDLRLDDVAEESKLVNDYPPGKRTKCFVNPKNPSQAVINRDFQMGEFLLCLVPIGFIVVGVFGVTDARKRIRYNCKDV
jgi:hypothetical protein